MKNIVTTLSSKEILELDEISNTMLEVLNIPKLPKCGDCCACCIKEDIYMIPGRGDDPSKYQTVESPEGTKLAHKLNGECIYLIDNKCSIYEDRPSVCRRFDCAETIATTYFIHGADGVEKLHDAFDSTVMQKGGERLNAVNYGPEIIHENFEKLQKDFQQRIAKLILKD